MRSSGGLRWRPGGCSGRDSATLPSVPRRGACSRPPSFCSTTAPDRRRMLADRSVGHACRRTAAHLPDRRRGAWPGTTGGTRLTARPLTGRSVAEVISAEVLVHRPIFEHVVDGGEDRGDDGHDCLLGAAPRFDAVELGLQIAVFLFYRRPGALHQRGFEPGTALAYAIGSTLAGTLVVAWTYAGPRDEMCAMPDFPIDPELRIRVSPPVILRRTTEAMT